MNDEPSASSASASQRPGDGDVRELAAPTAAELAERRKKNREMFNKKRGELLDDLLRNLDILIYAELSTIYYMDCSFLRFLLRAIVQFVLLTPKPPLFPDRAADHPILTQILGSNLICILLHLWLSPPSAGEDTRGYLHGGLAMDFIGQKGPSSKKYLLLLDLLVFVLQLVHMAANVVRKRLRDGAVPVTVSTSTPAATGETAQDLDSEERGVNRAEEAHDIEMQTLNPSGTATSTAPAPTSSESPNESSERDSLLASTALPQTRTDAPIFDAFNAGQIVLADLDLWKSLKEQRKLMQNLQAEAASGTGTTSSSAMEQTFRAELARRVLRMRVGTDALRESMR